ncbi:MAG: hypothetical protein CVU59_12765 [Deltaproteobacteria bacterium HGW-Deltaproteobacteria-17]|nr:MAG: hypothetical protein CVU59_12765 [Deltaproteobacteria bacterium HGW-Deltaproteobacteria-17]
MKKNPKEAQLQEMEALAEKLGVEIRVETLRSLHPRKGGLCRVQGAFVLLIDKKASLDERWFLFTEGLCLFDLDGEFLSPKLRALLQRMLGDT